MKIMANQEHRVFSLLCDSVEEYWDLHEMLKGARGWKRVPKDHVEKHHKDFPSQAEIIKEVQAMKDQLGRQSGISFIADTVRIEVDEAFDAYLTYLKTFPLPPPPAKPPLSKIEKMNNKHYIKKGRVSKRNRKHNLSNQR